MAALIKIAVVLLALAVLTWRKVTVGLVLILSAILLSLLFGFSNNTLCFYSCVINCHLSLFFYGLL